MNIAGVVFAQPFFLGQNRSDIQKRFGMPSYSEEGGAVHYNKVKIFSSNWQADLTYDSLGKVMFYRCQCKAAEETMLAITAVIANFGLSRFHQTGLLSGVKQKNRLWVTPDSLSFLKLTDRDSITVISSWKRNAYLVRIDSNDAAVQSLLRDSLLPPLDNEAKMVAATWNKYLSLGQDTDMKYQFWSCKDTVGYNLCFLIPNYPRKNNDGGISARISGIAKDQELGYYTLWTSYSRFDEGREHYYGNEIIYAVLEEGQWRFINALPYLTQNWVKRDYGNIIYHYREEGDSLAFDPKLAAEAVRFRASIAELFGKPAPTPINYYYNFVGANPYALFGFRGPTITVGLFDPTTNSIISNANQCDKHELTHSVMGTIGTPRIIYEGLAEFLGRDSEEYDLRMTRLSELLEHHPSITFDDILLMEKEDSLEYMLYATGELLLHEIYKKGGMKLVREFYDGIKTPADVYAAVKTYLHLKLTQVLPFIKTKALQSRKQWEVLHPDLKLQGAVREE